MKKIFFIAILSFTILFTGNLQAQKLYLEIGGGYGWALPETVLGADNYQDFDNPDNSYEKNMLGTLGQGANITLTPGYMFNKYVGVELGFNYFVGAETVMDNRNTNDPEKYGYDKTVANSNQFRALPSLVFNTGGEKVYGYAKAGLVLPLAGYTTGIKDQKKITHLLPAGLIETKIDVETKTSGSFTIGYRGALGLGYKVFDFMDINLEVFYTSLNVKAKRRDFTSFKYNGVDIVGDPSTAKYVLEIDYVDELTSESNNELTNPNYDVNKPKEELATKTNFSQLGVQLSIKFNF
ncbi:MAG: outer membrane beta-barrel protein [Brumimicrobium sp.]